MKMILTFATFNGDHTLPRMMESLTELVLPKSVELEILAVDNASTDDSSRILHDYVTRLPLTVLNQPVPGKNAALNMAVEYAMTETRDVDLVIFTDDDVIFDTDFALGYESLIADEPSFSLFGGSITGLWEKSPPESLLQQVPLSPAYSITNTWREKGPIESGKLFGPNMAVRRQVFETGMRFDERFGPKGGLNALGDETDFLQRAESAGFPAFFDPGIHVGHIIREWQLEERWIEDRAYKAGQAFVHEQVRLNGSIPPAATLFGYPRWAIRKAAQLGLRKYSYRFTPIAGASYKNLWDHGFNRGYMVEWKKAKEAT